MTELSPEIKQQLEEQKKNCIFCQIIEGKQQANKIYEDEEMLCILDIRPAVKGHLLIMPKEHSPILPLVPQKTFEHIFGILPQLIAAQKKSMIMTGSTLFLANGAVAGQQSPHFLFHLLGRDTKDDILNYFFEPKKIVEEEQNKAKLFLKHNIPMMMQRNIGAMPIETDKIYEDNKIEITISETPQAAGHIEIRSKEEPKYFEKLTYESAAHIFHAASFAATALFEGLGAHGTNIIMKTGESADNPDGKLVVHVLPRYQDDGLDLMLKPSEQNYDTEKIIEAYADETYKIRKTKKEKETKETQKTETRPKNTETNDDIMQAIRNVQRKIIQ